MKKRLISLILSLVLLSILFAVPAFAGSASLTEVAERIAILMTETSNITVTGTAEFCLDDFNFKYAEGTIIQDGTSSYQSIMLDNFDPDGGSSHNGYAVSNYDGECRVLERHLGKDHFRSTWHNTKESLIRPSAFNTQLFRLACLAAETLDNDSHVTTSAIPGGGTRVELAISEADMPFVIQPVANLIWQFVARHYANLDYTDFQPHERSKPENYGTIADGILYTTSEIRIADISILFDLDADNDLTFVDGDILIKLVSPSSDTPRLLRIRTGLEIGIPGETSFVDSDLIPAWFKFLGDEHPEWPEDGMPVHREIYGVEADNLAAVIVDTIPEVPAYTEKLTHRSFATADEAVDYAMEVLSMKAFGLDCSPEDLWWKAEAEEEGSLWHVDAGRADSNEVAFRLTLDSDGHVFGVSDEECGFASSYELHPANMESPEWTAYRRATSFALRDFIGNLNDLTPAEAESMPLTDNPTLAPLPFFALFERDGRYFMQWYSDPDAENNVRKSVTLQIVPAIRVVEFADWLSADSYPRG